MIKIINGLLKNSVFNKLCCDRWTDHHFSMDGIHRHLVLITGLLGGGLAQAATALEKITLPAGFSISLYAANVTGARSLAMGNNGTLFVGTRDEGVVYALPDGNRDGHADAPITVARGLDTPNGVAFHQGHLYIAENHRIVRLRDIERRLDNPPRPEVIYDHLPRYRHHGWRYLRAGPDGALYVALGAPCNACERPGLASIVRLHRDGSGFAAYAGGVRNSVGFDWHPTTRTLWFTDNGRDGLGDDAPPDELNAAPRAGLHFGFPYCHGGSLPDPGYGKLRPCRSFTPPNTRLGPHVAALGMRFYTGTMFPAPYRHQIFIAEHGSWNRSKKAGYRISLVNTAGTGGDGYKAFADGWLQGETSWGRPVDIEIAPDGALLVSDDAAGAVYRIAYRKPKPAKSP